MATKTALTVRISCATVRIHKCNEEESIYFIEVLQRTFRQAERNETDRWRRWLLSGAPNGYRNRIGTVEARLRQDPPVTADRVTDPKRSVL